MRSCIIGTVLLFIFGFSVEAQEHKKITPEVKAPKVVQKTTEVDEAKVFRAVQQKAYPTTPLPEFFAANIQYPELAKKAHVAGRIILEAVVEKDGSISDIKVIKGLELGHGLPDEAIRVLKLMPKWQPAIADGEAVRSYYIVPVSFNL